MTEAHLAETRAVAEAQALRAAKRAAQRQGQHRVTVRHRRGGVAKQRADAHPAGHGCCVGVVLAGPQ